MASSLTDNAIRTNLDRHSNNHNEKQLKFVFYPKNYRVSALERQTWLKFREVHDIVLHHRRAFFDIAYLYPQQIHIHDHDVH